MYRTILSKSLFLYFLTFGISVLTPFLQSAPKEGSIVATVDGKEWHFEQLMPYVNSGLQPNRFDLFGALKKAILVSSAKQIGISQYPFDIDDVSKDVLKQLGITPHVITEQEALDYFQVRRHLYLKSERRYSFRFYEEIEIELDKTSIEELNTLLSDVQPKTVAKELEVSALSSHIQKKLNRCKVGDVVKLETGGVIIMEAIRPEEFYEFKEVKEKVLNDCQKARWLTQLKEWERQQIQKAVIVIKDDYKHLFPSLE